MLTHVRRARVAATRLTLFAAGALALCLVVDRSIRW
jgi:hypothetical protein